MFAACNDGYEHLTHAKYFGDEFIAEAEGAHTAYQDDIPICQFGLQGRRRKSPQFMGVPSVVTVRAPFEVCHNIVGFDRIDMVDDGENVGIGNESDGYQTVDIEGGSLSILAEYQSGISPPPDCLGNLRLHQTAFAPLYLPIGVDDFSVHASHLSQIADLVEAFEANNGSPFFCESDIHTTGCPSGYVGSTIKGPSHAATFGGSAIMASDSNTYNRSRLCL